MEILLPNLNIQNNEHYHRNKRILHLHNSSSSGGSAGSLGTHGSHSSENRHHLKNIIHGKLIEHEHIWVKLTPEQKKVSLKMDGFY